MVFDMSESEIKVKYFMSSQANISLLFTRMYFQSHLTGRLGLYCMPYFMMEYFILAIQHSGKVNLVLRVYGIFNVKWFTIETCVLWTLQLTYMLNLCFKVKCKDNWNTDVLLDFFLYSFPDFGCICPILHINRTEAAWFPSEFLRNLDADLNSVIIMAVQPKITILIVIKISICVCPST